MLCQVTHCAGCVLAPAALAWLRNGDCTASLPGLPRFFFFVLRFAFSIIHGSRFRVLYKRKPKNKKWGRPGNEAGDCISCKKCSQVAVFTPYVTCIWAESCYSQKKAWCKCDESQPHGQFLHFTCMCKPGFLCASSSSYQGGRDLPHPCWVQAVLWCRYLGSVEEGNTIKYKGVQRNTRGTQRTLILISLGVSFLISASSRSPNPAGQKCENVRIHCTFSVEKKL